MRQLLVALLIAGGVLAVGFNDHATVEELPPARATWTPPAPVQPAPAPPPVRPRQQVMAEYRGVTGPLTGRDVHRIARAVGFTPEAARQATRIARCESRHQPTVHFNNPATGDNSYGLMQINMIGDLGPARRQRFGLTSNEQLLDPVRNMRITWRISKGGRDWSPWSCARHTGVI